MTLDYDASWSLGVKSTAMPLPTANPSCSPLPFGRNIERSPKFVAMAHETLRIARMDFVTNKIGEASLLPVTTKSVAIAAGTVVHDLCELPHIVDRAKHVIVVDKNDAAFPGGDLRERQAVVFVRRRHFPLLPAAPGANLSAYLTPLHVNAVSHTTDAIVATFPVLPTRSAALDLRDPAIAQRLVDANALVADLPRRSFAELRAFARPPLKLLHLMEAVMVIFDHAQPGEWNAQKRILGDVTRFVQDITTFDVAQLKIRQINRLGAMTEVLRPDFCEEIGRVAEVGPPLAKWVNAVYENAV
jgi:hypothetical protein